MMKLAFRFIFGVLALLLAALAGVYGYLGGFQTVQVKRGAFGPVEIIYTTHRGPYKSMGKSWAQFERELETAGLTVCHQLGVYLDPPETPQDELRSILGCQIDGLSADKKSALKEKFPHYIIPQSDALMSLFPFKNYASYFLAPAKVYPEVQKRLEAESLEAVIGIELYDVRGDIKEIGFVIPIGLEKEIVQPLFDAFE